MPSKKKLKRRIAWLTTQLRVKEIHEENANRETLYAERRCSQLRIQLMDNNIQPEV